MEIMIFLLEEELDTSNNFHLNEEIAIQLERAIDSQIFEKYMNLTRLQAMRKSIEFCDERLDNVAKEDQSLIEYTVFMHAKFKEYESMLQQLKNELQKKKKNNKKLHKQVFGVSDSPGSRTKRSQSSYRKGQSRYSPSITSRNMEQVDSIDSELLDSDDSYTSGGASERKKSKKMMNKFDKGLIRGFQ